MAELERRSVLLAWWAVRVNSLSILLIRDARGERGSGHRLNCEGFGDR